MTLCGGCGQVGVMEWIWLASFWVMYLLRYDSFRVLCKAIAFLVSFYNKSRGLYALIIYFAYSLHFSCLSSGLLVFTHLGGIYLLSASIDNTLNLLYISYIIYSHTTALLIDLQSLHMSALCNVTPYLYYSALISLYLSLLSSCAFFFLCLTVL